MRPVLQPGDVVLTAGNTLMGRLIRWGETHRGNPSARVNHATLCVESPDVIVEAAAVARRVNLWDFHTQDGVVAYRPKNLSLQQKAILVNVAESWVGKPYPIRQLFAYLIDNKLFGGRTVARWLIAVNPDGVCSRLVRIAFAAIGLNFGVQEPDPDDMDDFCRTHPDKYELVYSQNLPEVTNG